MILLGVKKLMTEVIRKYRVTPVTVIDITEAVVAGKRQLENGRFALLVGYGTKKHPTKPEVGQFRELGYVPQKVSQVIVDKDLFDSVKIGDKLVDKIEQGIKVDVTGISKGKGFAGVIKRWGFSRQPKTHGQSDRERHPGAIGAQTPGRVLKGKKMAGRMGNERVTVKNLEVVDKLELDGRTYVLIKGAVPGKYGSIVMLKINED